MVNSIPASSNEWLLTKVLRKEWGVAGLVLSDWGAEANGVDSIKAQMDLCLTARSVTNDAVIRNWYNSASTSKEKAEITSLVDRGVRNVLNLIVKTPAFKGERDGLTAEMLNQRSANFTNSDGYRASKPVNLEVASHAMVLLKNNGALPLDVNTKGKVALVTSSLAYNESLVDYSTRGSAAVKDLVIEGGGSGMVLMSSAYAVTLEEGLKTYGFNVV